MSDPGSTDVHTDAVSGSEGAKRQAKAWKVCDQCGKKYGKGYRSCPRCTGADPADKATATAPYITKLAMAEAMAHLDAQGGPSNLSPVAAAILVPDLVAHNLAAGVPAPILKAYRPTVVQCSVCTTPYATSTYRHCPSYPNTAHLIAEGYALDAAGEVAKAFGFSRPGNPHTTVFRPDPRLHSHAFIPEMSKPSRCRDCGMGTGAHSRMVYKAPEEEDEETPPAPTKKSLADRLLNRDGVVNQVALDDQYAYAVVKAREPDRYTLGPVYMPETLDAHGEFTGRETLQKAVWDFVRSQPRTIYLQHSPKPAGEWVEIMAWPHEVEANLTQVDGRVRKTKFPEGTVYMGVIWEPWAYEEVKKGKLTGYSMGGFARRIEAQVQPSSAPVTKHGDKGEPGYPHNENGSQSRSGRVDASGGMGGLGKSPRDPRGTGGSRKRSRSTPISDEEWEERQTLWAHLTQGENAEYGIGGRHDTSVKHVNAKGLYTTARQLEHKKIVDALLADAEARGIPKNGEVIVMGGLGGAGKTHAITKGGQGRPLGVTTGSNGIDSHVVINPDLFKEILIRKGLVPVIPGFTPMESAHLVHEESAHMADTFARGAAAKGFNLIHDFTLGSSGSGSKRLASLGRYGEDSAVPRKKSTNYSRAKRSLLFVDIDPEASIKSSDSRWRRGVDEYLVDGVGSGGRPVPHSITRGQATKPGSKYRSRNREAAEILIDMGTFARAIVLRRDGDSITVEKTLGI